LSVLVDDRLQVSFGPWGRAGLQSFSTRLVCVHHVHRYCYICIDLFGAARAGLMVGMCAVGCSTVAPDIRRVRVPHVAAQCQRTFTRLEVANGVGHALHSCSGSYLRAVNARLRA
jgi:hypothetical protein